MPEFTEQIPKYKLTEEFDNAIKTIEFSSNDLSAVFSNTMDFLIYCGIPKDNLHELFNDYKDGFI